MFYLQLSIVFGAVEPKRCQVILLLTSELNSGEATQRLETLIQDSVNRIWKFYKKGG